MNFLFKKSGEQNILFLGFFYVFSVCFICSGLLFSCGAPEGNDSHGGISVGIVFDAGGKDDKSFNSMAWEGASRAKDDFGIDLMDVEPGDQSSLEPAIRALAECGTDLIIGVGFIATPYIESVAPEFPESKFCIVEGEVKGDNVSCLFFQEHEGAFLVGMIAAMKTQTDIIGFVGGMDIPLIHRFVMGYRAGAEYVNPDVTVLVNYAGITPAAWSDPTKGKELAMSQYDRGADIVYAAAGATGLGVFDAAAETGNFVIGNDANQNWIKPGNVLTSMLKRVDVAVYETIRSVVENKFQGGIYWYSLSNKGVGYAVDGYNQDLLSQKIIDKVEQAKNSILSGELEVPDYYDTMR